MNILEGKLSYLLAAFCIVGGGAGYLLGVLEGTQASELILGGLAVFGIRRAISNI